MPINHLLSKAAKHPRMLFLVDGLGALLSAFLLGVVLPKFEDVFGIPSSVLYILAVIPIFFALYDLYCYLKRDNKSGIYLRIIAILNLLYCCVSLGLIIACAKTITTIGWCYIIIEIVIVGLLAIFEYMIGRKVKDKR